MREELKRLQRELGISFIHVTHSQDEAMALADLMVVMDLGQIRQTGTPRKIFEAPADAFIARFIGGHNVVPTPQGLVAVRADRCRIGQAGNGAHFPAGSSRSSIRVRSSGSHSKRKRVSRQQRCCRTTSFCEPRAAGDAATLVWSEADAHPVAVS